jgi:hypothetical protein
MGLPSPWLVHGHLCSINPSVPASASSRSDIEMAPLVTVTRRMPATWMPRRPSATSESAGRFAKLLRRPPGAAGLACPHQPLADHGHAVMRLMPKVMPTASRRVTSRRRVLALGVAGMEAVGASSGQAGPLPDRHGRRLVDPTGQQRSAGLHVHAPVPAATRAALTSSSASATSAAHGFAGAVAEVEEPTVAPDDGESAVPLSPNRLTATKLTPTARGQPPPAT